MIVDLKCPHMDKEKAKQHDTLYYCGATNTPFNAMMFYCKDCPIYNRLIAKAASIILIRGSVDNLEVDLND